AMMGTAQAGGPDRATKAAEQAVACPLLEGIDLSGAKGVLVLIAASKNTFKLAESRNAMNTIRRYAAEDAHVIYGTAYDDSLGDQLRVTVIATGLSPARRQQAPISVVHSAPVLRTGTDNLPILNNVAQPMSVGGLGGAPMQHDYSQLSTPSVWRNGRTQAAAKVDALASNGMDEIEIPAFLRKQAD
ncbi:MAG: cell division protein FtsZ, partial [Aquincola sp.]|nr:cell division protein FtsZ [Aquincola sp.]